MRIGVVQASSQKDKNEILYQCVKKAVGENHEVINFGVNDHITMNYSYIEVAMMVSLLLASESVDFMVTGCSSGQGMMLACNSLPGVICGYVPTGEDAFLFGRINDGNAVSLSLGLHYGWCGEIRLQGILDRLFDEPFGIGYPSQDAKRKQRDTKLLKHMYQVGHKTWDELIPLLDQKSFHKALDYIYDDILSYGQNDHMKELLKNYKKDEE